MLVTPPPGDTPSRASAAHTVGVLALLWSWIVMVFGLFLLVIVPLLVKATEDGYCENIDHPGPCASIPELLAPGLVVSAVGAWSVAASVAFRRGRRWGRGALVATFSLWGLGAAAALVHQIAAPDQREAGAIATFAALAAFFVTIVVLAAQPASKP